MKSMLPVASTLQRNAEQDSFLSSSPLSYGVLERVETHFNDEHCGLQVLVDRIHARLGNGVRVGACPT